MNEFICNAVEKMTFYEIGILLYLYIIKIIDDYKLAGNTATKIFIFRLQNIDPSAKRERIMMAIIPE